MLVIQRPTVEATRRGGRQPSAVRHRPARARLRPHDRQLAAPHAAVVDPRRGHHAGPLRRRPPRVRHHRRCHRGRHRHHPEPQGHRAHVDSRRAGHAAPRRAWPGRRHRRRHPVPEPTSRSSTRTSTSPRSTARAAWPSTSPSSGAVATSRPTARRDPTRSASSRSTRSSRRSAGSPSRSSRPASSSRPNYDRLVLDIETDGSITPREALASAGATLRSLVELVAEMSDEPQGLELGEVAGTSAGSPDLDLPDRGPRPVRASPQLPQAGPGQHDRRAARRRPRTTCWTSPTSARSRSTRSSQKLDERGLSLRGRGLRHRHARHTHARAAASAATRVAPAADDGQPRRVADRRRGASSPPRPRPRPCARSPRR